MKDKRKLRFNGETYILVTHPECGIREAIDGRDYNNLDFENDPKRISALEEMEIIKATTSNHIDNIIQNKNSFTKYYSHFRIRRRPGWAVVQVALVRGHSLIT